MTRARASSGSIPLTTPSASISCSSRRSEAVHYFGKFEDRALSADSRYAGHSSGYTEASLVSDQTGSVHTGLAIAELAPGGMLSAHVHSYEEGFYVLAGRGELTIDNQSCPVGPGDFG